MAIWHVAPLRFAPAFMALGVCEHIWPFNLREFWATLLSPKWAEIFVVQIVGDKTPAPSRALRPRGAAYVPILLSDVEQEQRPSGNEDREPIVVGAGLRDGEGERAYTAFAPDYKIFASRTNVFSFLEDVSVTKRFRRHFCRRNVRRHVVAEMSVTETSVTETSRIFLYHLSFLIVSRLITSFVNTIHNFLICLLLKGMKSFSRSSGSSS